MIRIVAPFAQTGQPQTGVLGGQTALGLVGRALDRAR